MEDPNNIISKKIEKFNKLAVYEKMLGDASLIIENINNENINIANFRENLYNFSKYILDESKGSEKILVSIISFIEGTDGFITHTLNTAVFSAILSILLDIDDKFSMEIVIAALLHDIGRLKYTDKIVEKFVFKDESKSNMDRDHPLWGKRLALYHLRLSNDIGSMISNHHEHYDGKGFPNGLDHTNLTTGDCIIITSNILELILQKIKYSGIPSFSKSIEMILTKHPGKFDPSVAGILTEFFDLKIESRIYKRYEIPNSRGYIQSDYSSKQYPFSLIDISAGGLMISAKNKIPMTGLFRISIHLTDELSIKNKSCIILWEEKDEKGFNYGIEFKTPEEDMIKNVMTILTP
jgi:response regulator RpfG family c-di-GMP phosphodiesterase